MRKGVLLLVLALIPIMIHAKCLNTTAKALILVDDTTLKIYTKLHVGSEINKGVYVVNVSKVLPNYEGWLPAALVKVNKELVPRCMAAHLPVLKSCSGDYYCLEPIAQLQVFIYHGNFTEKLVKLFNGIPKGMGNPNSKLWIVELLDPFCPYCALFYSQGGGRLIEKWVSENKVYMIPVMVAFHQSTKGYIQSLALAYVQQGYAEGNKTAEFFNMEHKIIANLKDLVEGKKVLVNVVDVLKGPANLPNKSTNSEKRVIQELMKWNQDQLRKATEIFPAIATPTTVLVNRETGLAIAVMGAQSSQTLEQVVTRFLHIQLK